MATEIPKVAASAVLDAKGEVPAGSTIVKGCVSKRMTWLLVCFSVVSMHGRRYDFNKGIDLAAMLKCYKFMGFQAQHLGQAFEQLNQMVKGWPYVC